ncbi:MAG: hypothetical protein H6711_28365 [Myxococcales bacterium]|nr:hypothetical protein [Myxococcales bacterium]
MESKPSVRGWTMIMDDPEEAAAATPPAAPAAPAAPSTRGWTMLEELNESPETESGTGVPMSQEQAAATAAPTSRGWTMFMEAELEGEQAEEAAEVEAEPEAESDFYEGTVKTAEGTVIAFAPDAPKAPPAGAPVAAAPTAPTPSSTAEPMTSFGAKLHGEEEPVASFAAKLRGEPEAAPEPELEAASLAELAQQAAPAVQPPSQTDMPTFGGGAGFDLKPTAPTMPEPQAASYDDEEEPKKSNTGTFIAIGLMIAVVAVVAYFLAT